MKEEYCFVNPRAVLDCDDVATMWSLLRAWESKYQQFWWDVITHPCPKFNRGLAKQPLNLVKIKKLHPINVVDIIIGIIGMILP